MSSTKRVRVCGAISLALFGLSACETTYSPEQAVDAVLIPSDMSEAIILEALSRALRGRDIRLSPTVFSDNAVLILDPAFVSGRSFATPDHFRLQRYQGQCQLLHEETGKSYALDGVTCKAMASDGL